MKILLIHGPNLNLLGERESEKYGHTSSADLLKKLQGQFSTHVLDYFQSNNEGELVGAIQHARHGYNGILINPGAFSHTSIAIADAIRSIHIPCFCVHISNIYQRETFRHTDLIGDACAGAIAGLGLDGYALAMECLLDKLS